MAQKHSRNLKKGLKEVSEEFKIAQDVLSSIEPNIIRYRQNFKDENEFHAETSCDHLGSKYIALKQVNTDLENKHTEWLRTLRKLTTENEDCKLKISQIGEVDKKYAALEFQIQQKDAQLAVQTAELEAIRNQTLTDEDLWKGKAEQMETQYNDLLAQVKSQEYASVDPMSFLSSQAKAIEELLSNGSKQRSRSSTRQKPDTASKEIITALELNNLDKAADIWGQKKYAKLVGLSDMQNFEALKNLTLFRDQNPPEEETRMKPVISNGPNKENDEKTIRTLKNLNREKSTQLQQFSLLKEENTALNDRIEQYEDVITSMEKNWNNTSYDLKVQLESERQTSEVLRGERDLLEAELRKYDTIIRAKEEELTQQRSNSSQSTTRENANIPDHVWDVVERSEQTITMMEKEILNLKYQLDSRAETASTTPDLSSFSYEVDEYKSLLMQKERQIHLLENQIQEQNNPGGSQVEELKMMLMTKERQIRILETQMQELNAPGGAQATQEMHELQGMIIYKEKQIRMLEAQLDEMGVSGDIRRMVARAVERSEETVEIMEGQMRGLQQKLDNMMLINRY